jgi:hypothetical protein
VIPENFGAGSSGGEISGEEERKRRDEGARRYTVQASMSRVEATARILGCQHYCIFFFLARGLSPSLLDQLSLCPAYSLRGPVVTHTPHLLQRYYWWDPFPLSPFPFPRLSFSLLPPPHSSTKLLLVFSIRHDLSHIYIYIYIYIFFFPSRTRSALYPENFSRLPFNHFYFEPDNTLKLTPLPPTTCVPISTFITGINFPDRSSVI